VTESSPIDHSHFKDGDQDLFPVLAQIFESRQTEPIFDFSLRGKHCFPYL
jgi:hypothetical protein